MNMKQIINKITAIALIMAAVTSCVDDSKLEYGVNKPASISNMEYLNDYNALKTYVNRTDNPNFKLGAGVSVADYNALGLAYRVITGNFDEMTAGYEMKHGAVVQNDGRLNLTNISNFLKNAQDAGISVYGHTLCWHANQNAKYLNSLIEPEIIPSELEPQWEEITVQDFETDNIDATYPMTSGGSATVVVDPKGVSGKVLNVKGAQTHPQFTVNLPEGRTLGDYKSVILDFYGTGSTGLYGQGMRMSINGGTMSNFDSPSALGCPDGDWGRGKIILQLSNLNLTADQKKLRNFILAVGSATGSGDYYIDNISMQWEKSGDKIIEKTEEEKKQILTAALEEWISGIMSVSASVNAWDIVNEPMSDWPDPSQLKTGMTKETLAADEFYWQDYLGKDYAVTAIQMARRQEGHGNDLLFINDYGLENNLDKCKGLIEYVKYIESKGVKVDGIGTQMHVSLNSCDREKIAEHFRLLAATGKLIKISELDMGITVDGKAIKTNAATDEQLRAQADLYKYIVKTYFDIIPSAQRYGITQWAVTDSPANSSWRTGEPIGLWSLNYDNRKHAYAGFADGLSGEK